MVRIDVTPNVTFTGSSPSTRENVTTGGRLSARRAVMRILRCNCVDLAGQLWRIRLLCDWTALMNDSVPGVAAPSLRRIDARGHS